jgi:hypothetical protein
MSVICGFAAVNNGKHCVPDGKTRCVVCRSEIVRKEGEI